LSKISHNKNAGPQHVCVCFSRQILLCFAQNNWNFIGIFSLSSVNLSNFANFLEKFTKFLISQNPWEKLPKKINFNHWENQVFVGQLQHCLMLIRNRNSCMTVIMRFSTKVVHRKQKNWVLIYGSQKKICKIIK
jgi:hypothetical protein